VIFFPEERQAGAPEDERARARAHGRAEDERWHRRKDGSHLWASGLLMPLRNGDGGFVKIVRDLTERRRAEERIRENEERFRLLATSIPQLVFQTRHDGARTWASPQWIDFTGLSSDESLGFGWLDAMHPEDRAPTRTAWRDAPEKGDYHVEHRVWSRRDGEHRRHQTRARPLDAENPAAGDWVGTMTDIHDLRGLQHRQQVLMAELQHRTRNLLAVVQSIANQTLRRSPSLEAFAGEFRARLQALSRVQGLLSQADHQATIGLDRLVAAELAAHGDSGLEEGKIVFHGPPVALPATSAQALGLALHELATNAVKHGALAQPGGRLVVTWSLGAAETEPHVTLEWRETGVSLPDVPPSRAGFGRELIERALPHQLGARSKLEFATDGVRCELIVPVAPQGAGDG
jgi:PAS domain S-box-containing protein